MRPTRPTTFNDPALLGISLSLFALAMTCSQLGAPSWLENLLRAGVLSLSAGIFAMSAVIVKTYYMNFKIAPDKARLLPRHVVQLGVMVMIFVFVAGMITITKIDGNLVWFGIPLLLPAVFIGFTGLLDMIQWLPDRRHKPSPTGEER